MCTPGKIAGFGGAIDRGAPFLVQQIQNRGNERARVSDTDPKNEVRDVPSPPDRDVISPRADASGNLVPKAKKTERRGACSDGKSYPPPAWRRLFNHARDPFRQPAEIAPIQDQRHALDGHRRFGFDHVRRWVCFVHKLTKIDNVIALFSLGHRLSTGASRTKHRPDVSANTICNTYFITQRET